MWVPGIAGNFTPGRKSPERPRVRVIWASLLPASSRKYQLPGGREGCCSVAQSSPAVCDPMDSSRPGSPSFTLSWTLLRFMFIESMMPPTISSAVAPFSSCPQSFPASRFFSIESALCIRWPKSWSSSFSISPSNPCCMWITIIVCDPHCG